jgi:hypothetical protein
MTVKRSPHPGTDRVPRIFLTASNGQVILAGVALGVARDQRRAAAFVVFGVYA